jgi:hypothetical protein
MWGRMRMSPTDLADVGAPTYTYLVNGQAPDANWTGLFARGERVRLRFVNGSAMTYFDVRIPGLKMTVVAADGQRVHPVTVDEFRIAVAETLDVVVEPQDQPYTIFAQAMDRGGYARATSARWRRMIRSSSKPACRTQPRMACASCRDSPPAARPPRSACCVRDTRRPCARWCRNCAAASSTSRSARPKSISPAGAAPRRS